ncbi:hypothetical protein SAMN05660649_00503 [Desulfotomaculum arcticum]|uniref:Uncharacterized protein n=1 Tax=Desulfotruncus arcticus DSM 17038 TaxID=1121424 RepID=A0A1I2NDJ9_9FIRM|nr:hypothetical protein [Desulfotruncus arcticus]SFG02005.1 hypothetical protein SAMN05660649_00503 [Desulfotomaculum arcticum] [Desulfotruncus arcticus DSM 17038]
MQIEILTRQVEKKTDLLTMLSREPDVTATGDTIKIPDLILHITENYLLLKLSSLQWAERVIPMLFSVAQISNAGQFHQPVTDAKILLTARCYDPVKQLSYLHEVSHLDLENNELLGIRMAEWRSRDVAIVAHAALAVQGNIVTAKIKFLPHFRDSQYNCQECIDQISLHDLMEPISPEFKDQVLPLRVSGPIIHSLKQVSAEGWQDFINNRHAAVDYNHKTDTFMVNFNDSGYISFKQQQDKKKILCQIELKNPYILNAMLLNSLKSIFGIDQLNLSHTAENIVLSPENIMKFFSFKKQAGFHQFTLREAEFDAVYDVKQLKLTLSATINTVDAIAAIDQISSIFEAMKIFMNRMLTHAGTNS